MVLLIVLSILNINEFNKFMRRKLAMNGIKRIKSSEIKFTKVILLLTILFIIVRVPDLLSGLSYRMISINAIDYSSGLYAVINFARQATYLLEFSNYTIGIFIFASIDNNVFLLMKIALNKMIIIQPIDYKYN